MEIPHRIVFSIRNSKNLVWHHPLIIYASVWNFEGRKSLWWIVSGQGGFDSHADDNWKDLGNYLKNKIWHRSMK
jgi:hypothetical protein